MMHGYTPELTPLTNEKIECALMKLEQPESVLASKQNMQNMEYLWKLLINLFQLHSILEEES